MNKAKLGLPGRDEEIEHVINLIRNLGKLGVPVWCYEWMPVFNWMRTSTTAPARGGALATAYDHDLMKDAPLTEYGVVSEETLWTNLEYFLKAVVPEAEKAGVQAGHAPRRPAALAHPRPGRASCAASTTTSACSTCTPARSTASRCARATSP